MKNFRNKFGILLKQDDYLSYVITDYTFVEPKKGNSTSFVSK